MKTLLLSLFLIPLFATQEESNLMEASDDQGNVVVKVLIRENVDGALIDVSGGYRVYNPETGKVLSSGFQGKRYYLQANSVGLKWGEGYPGVHQIKITPKNDKTTILVDGIQYKGSIVVYDINSRIQIVNEADVEDVVCASLSSILGNTNYESATYDAVAIAARTNLYNTILHSSNVYWNVTASEIDYQSHAAVLSNPNIEKAVHTTKHLILTYDEKPFATSWTEHSAGKTASFESIYRKKAPGPRGVFVGYAQKMREESKWKSVLSLKELAKLTGLETIKTIDLFQDQTSKKVYAVRFTDDKTFAEWTIFDLRKKVGLNRILSNDFTVHMIKDHIEFNGYGRGYGVGICLFTADQMAKIGDAAPQILNHFFPESTLIKLNTLPKSLFTNDTKEIKEDGTSESTPKAS
jgi:stage II sporulation protein D